MFRPQGGGENSAQQIAPANIRNSPLLLSDVSSVINQTAGSTAASNKTADSSTVVGNQTADVTAAANQTPGSTAGNLGHKGENPTPDLNGTSPAGGLNPTTTNSNTAPSPLGHKGENPTESLTAEPEPETGAEDPAEAARIDDIANKFYLVYNATDAYNISDLSYQQMGKVKYSLQILADKKNRNF